MTKTKSLAFRAKLRAKKKRGCGDKGAEIQRHKVEVGGQEINTRVAEVARGARGKRVDKFVVPFGCARGRGSW